MGSRGQTLRNRRDVVPGGRRHLHSVYLHRRSGARLRHRGGGFLRRALHGSDLSAAVSDLSAIVERMPQARLHHRGRFRAWPLRESLAGARRDDYRHRRHFAVHRLAARGYPGGGRSARSHRERHRGRPAAHHRVRGTRSLHLLERAARARVDCHRQGHPDLRRDLRHHHRRAAQARRFRENIRGGPGAEDYCSRFPVRTPRAPTARTPPWLWARRSRCFSTRIR